MRLFSYLRVSGKGQVSGDGPERQRAEIAKLDAEIVKEFFDGGVSGTVEGLDRPQFAAMLDEIECLRINGVQIDGIVIERMDRLARDLTVQELLIRELKQRDIALFAADQGLGVDVTKDEGDPTRRLIRQVLGAVAEFEKSVTVLKLRKARQRVKAIKGKCEGRKKFRETPFGNTISRVVEALWVPGQTSYQGLADLMNQGGYQTYGGDRWSRKLVWQLINKTLKEN